MGYIETSAKTRVGVDNLFSLAKEIRRYEKEKSQQSPTEKKKRKMKYTIL